MFALSFLFTAVMALQDQHAELQKLAEQLQGQAEELAECRAKLAKTEAELKLLREKKPVEEVPLPEKVATVTAVSPEIGLVVISIGRDDGVKEGQIFIISRRDQFIAKIVIDRVNNKWSAGRIVKETPRVSDEVRRGVLDPSLMKLFFSSSGPRSATLQLLRTKKVTLSLENVPLASALEEIQRVSGLKFVVEAPEDGQRTITVKVDDLLIENLLQFLLSHSGLDFRVAEDGTVQIFRPAKAAPPLSPAASVELQAIRRELDDIHTQVRELTGCLLPSWERHGVAFEELAPEMRGHFGLKHGLFVRNIRKGSTAERAGLRPFDIVPDATEQDLLDAIDKGSRIRILREGRELHP